MSQKPIRKAVLAAAGFGTRFLPQTKAMPKEMLPLVDKPIIQYVVEELVAAGIKDIIVVTGYSKRSIEDHFDKPSQDLINNLKMGQKDEMLKEIESISELANFVYVRQKGPYGSATPLLDTEHLIGDEPFIYTYADDLIVAEPNRFKQMIDLYKQLNGSILPCIQIEREIDYKRYGIIDGERVRDGVIKMTSIVEKPGKDAAPSNMASVGGYLLTPEIFSHLSEMESDLQPDQEFMLQPAMQRLISEGKPFYGCTIQNAKYYDAGNKLEYLKTMVDFALKRDGIKEDFMAYLRSIVGS